MAARFSCSAVCVCVRTQDEEKERLSSSRRRGDTQSSVGEEEWSTSRAFRYTCWLSRRII